MRTQSWASQRGGIPKEKDMRGKEATEDEGSSQPALQGQAREEGAAGRKDLSKSFHGGLSVKARWE